MQDRRAGNHAALSPATRISAPAAAWTTIAAGQRQETQRGAFVRVAPRDALSLAISPMRSRPIDRCARSCGPGRSAPASRFAARKNVPPRRVLALPAAAWVIRTTAGIGWAAGARRSVVANPRRRRRGPLRDVLGSARRAAQRSAGSDRPGPLVARSHTCGRRCSLCPGRPANLLALRSPAVSDWSGRADLERRDTRSVKMAPSRLRAASAPIRRVTPGAPGGPTDWGCRAESPSRRRDRERTRDGVVFPRRDVGGPSRPVRHGSRRRTATAILPACCSQQNGREGH